jgi:hypothetical protein
MNTQNRKRAKRIEKALSSVENYDGALDWRATITDALVDLRHLCELKRISFMDCNRVASDHYAAEARGNE